MEVGQSQDLEMTESAPKVYDIIHPTPVSLQELSAMAISLEIWRREVNEYRTSQQLEEFKMYRSRMEITRAKSILPDLPSTINKTIEKCFMRFEDSFAFWLLVHYERVFDCYSHRNYILQHFDDFVCDFDGSIHYSRTAERMMRCVGFSTMIKFKIACLYFFEDDIQRIWPSVSRHLSVDLIHFHKCPQLYYWICRLRNDLSKVPISSRTGFNDSSTVDERMFDGHLIHNRPSVEYFWNRIPVEKQMQRARRLDRLDFVRFILPKLNDQQLDELVNDTHTDETESGFYPLFRYFHCKEDTVLRIWFYIRSKNIMNKSTFTHLVVNLIENEDYGCGEFNHENWEYLCREIWNDSPLDFKQSTISFISSDSEWLKSITKIEDDYHSNQIHVEFLLLILQDASVIERNSFWHNCWKPLIEAIRTKALQRMMQLCFENEDEIAQFKQKFMINSPVVLQVCVSLLKNANFDELKDFVVFFHPESRTARYFKQKILISAFLSGDCQLSCKIVNEAEKFGDFVKDVPTTFKNRLVLSSSFMWRLSILICGEGISFKTLTEFIDTFGSTDEVLKQIKVGLIRSLKEYVSTSIVSNWMYDLFSENKFKPILLWCLGSNEAVEEFKLTCIS
ncbi:uncharacterized protein LOC135847739 isoform X3 [Planococcus citri]|uniref:uncharacterized protein LOC135847739 isoform X3 n=1 Tax=Planococcus citri TaxID=170843 RepID=UPI0031F8D282